MMQDVSIAILEKTESLHYQKQIYEVLKDDDSKVPDSRIKNEKAQNHRSLVQNMRENNQINIAYKSDHPHSDEFQNWGAIILNTINL
jgi:hypothetical protein